MTNDDVHFELWQSPCRKPAPNMPYTSPKSQFLCYKYTYKSYPSGSGHGIPVPTLIPIFNECTEKFRSILPLPLKYGTVTFHWTYWNDMDIFQMLKHIDMIWTYFIGYIYILCIYIYIIYINYIYIYTIYIHIYI